MAINRVADMSDVEKQHAKAIAGEIYDLLLDRDASPRDSAFALAWVVLMLARSAAHMHGGLRRGRAPSPETDQDPAAWLQLWE